MPADRALPDLIARLRLDTTDLNRAVAQVNVAGGQLTSGFEKAATGAGKLESAQTRVVGSSRSLAQSHEQVSGKLDELEGITKKTSAAFGEFGGTGEKLTSKLQGLAGLSGLTGVGIAGVAAAAGIGAAVVIGKEAVDSFVTMGEEVLKFQRATGASADESSRLVDVFKQVGIGSDTAAAAMFRMNSRLEGTTPATAKVASNLASLGVEITKNKDGTINLTDTLEAVAEAYSRAGDQSQKDAIAYQAFGRSGAALIPILEQGAAGIKRMSDQSQLLFTQQQLEQVHAYNIEMERADQEHQKFNQTVGGAVVPVLTGLAEAFNKNAEANAYADEKMKDFHGDQSLVSAQWAIYKNEGLKAADASRQDAEATKDLAAASKAAADQIAAKRQEEDLDAAAAQSAADAWRKNADSQNQVVKAGEAVAAIEQENTDFATKHKLAIEAVNAAQDKYNDAVAKSGTASAVATDSAQKHKIALEGVQIAQDKYNEAVKKYGASSDQAAQASKALDAAHLHLSQTDEAAAAAAGKSSAQAATNNDAVAAAARNLDAAKLKLSDTDAKNKDLADRLSAAYQQQSDAMITAAKDTVDLADKQQQASGPAQTNMEKTLALIDALHKEEATLAPDSPLRQNIDGYIFQLETPAVKAAEDLRQKTLDALNDLNVKEQALFVTMGTTTNQQVADDTEHKIQLWEEHKNKLVGQSIVPDMVNAVIGEYDRMRTSTGSLAGTMTRDLVNEGANLASGLYSNVKGGVDSVIGIFYNFIQGLNGALGSFGVNIPNIQISPFAQGPSGVHSLAAGGVIPGYAPGHDTVPAMLSPGEGVLTPQTVRGLGGPKSIEALNSAGGLHGLGAASLSTVSSLAGLVGSLMGQCVVAVEKWTGHFFPVQMASQMTKYINSAQAAIGEIFVSTLPPFGHTGIVIGPNQVIDSNWGLDERVRIHALSDVPNIAGYISGYGGFGGLSGAGQLVSGALGTLLDIPGMVKGLVSPLSAGAHAALNAVQPQVIRNLGNSIIDHLAQGVISQAINAGSALAGLQASPTVGGNLGAWISQAIAITGVPGSWAGPLSTLIGRESGGNPSAINRDDINAILGHPSQGLMQLIPSNFATYHVPGTSGSILDPVANIAAGIRYILADYGSISNVQQANAALPPKGYAEGGPVVPNRVYMVGERGPELFVSNQAGEIMANAGQTGSVNSGRVEALLTDIKEVLHRIDGTPSLGARQASLRYAT